VLTQAEEKTMSKKTMSKSQSPAVRGPDFVAPQVSIAVEAPVITLINVLEVPPERQSELVEILEKATDEVIRHLPGFVSANIHCSLDGKRVANYAQWCSLEDFERMLANPEAQAHIREATAIAKADPVLYRVNSVHVSRE
jgi:antibiotic biosynthesis monooxygenase (ABM) superfamily enzyme